MASTKRWRGAGRSLVLAAALLAGCENPPGDNSSETPADDCNLAHPPWGHGGDLMLPGTDCLSCHVDGGHAAASPFTVAGTVFRDATCPEPVEGAVVHVIDDAGEAIALVTNEVGNFFTDQALVLPLHVTVEHDDRALQKPMAAGLGACNLCHTPDGSGWVRPARGGASP